ncbi:uncharacterized protein LOC113548272 [Rhopalosiphum maidis]|uniref:uncharacterized protein LOC113548272 n=1 Tax=Rhopalosiphum maidis TaxID=43146 RepID=UPI000EFF5AB7|nr:uncharacterized protein LOC113548272 [Rhopalosiphum maidis]
MMKTFSNFIDNLNYTIYGKENFVPSTRIENQNDENVKKNNDEDFIDGTVSVDDLIESMHHIDHTKKYPGMKQNLISTRKKENFPLLSIDDNFECIPKKKKLIELTSTSNLTLNNKEDNVGVNEGISSNINNNSPSSYDKNRSHFKYDSSSDDDEDNLLKKELMELRRLPPRKKSVNVDDDISKKCKFFIKNLKKCQSTAYVDTKYMPNDLDLLNYIKTMKDQFKSVLYKPKRTKFYKQLVLTPEHFKIFNLKEGYFNITADKGMVNLYDALKSFEKKHQYSIKFVKSKLGDALKRYTANRDICWDVVHLESNSEEDLLKYKLCYGAIPEMYVLELEMIVCRILLSKLYDESKISTDNVKQLENKDYDLLEGELELLVFNYWNKSTRDLFGYDERVLRAKKKKVFYYMYKKLKHNILHNDFGKNENRKLMFMNILDLYKSYAAFENRTILTAASLAFVKNTASKLVSFIGEEYDLWSVFFKKFNMHSTAFEFTIKALLEDRDNTFQYIFTRISEIDQFNISESAKSLWYYGLHEKMNSFVNVEDTVITKVDVMNCLSYYFSEPKHVPRALCVKLDNYYFLYIHLFVTFIINSNLYKYQKKLTVDNCKQFFILNDRRYHNYYWENFIPTFETKRMVTAMKNLIHNQLNARLDGDLSRKMKIDAEVTYMFFELVHLHLNYTLTPAMLREGPALTDVQWASIFISDIDKMEMFYLEGLRWDDKPWMLGGAPDDLDYDPETDGFDDPLKQQLCNDKFLSGDVIDNEAYSSKCEESAEEESDFNSDDSEAVFSLMNEVLMEKKMKRLRKQLSYRHKLYPKIKRGCIQKHKYLHKQIKPKIISIERKNLSQLQVKVEKPPEKNLKGVSTLEIERNMIKGGLLDLYELKNKETHITTPEGSKMFGLFSRNKIKSGSRSLIGCTLCPNSKICSYNLLVSEDITVACCLMCVEGIKDVVKTFTFEVLQSVLINRINYRFMSPLLFDENRKTLTKMHPMLSVKDMYRSTFNKFDPKYGRNLPKLDVFNNYCKFEDQEMSTTLHKQLEK